MVVRQNKPCLDFLLQTRRVIQNPPTPGCYWRHINAGWGPAVRDDLACRCLARDVWHVENALDAFDSRQRETFLRQWFAIPLLLLVLALCGCGKPVPSEKSSYVGEWQHPAMYLLLTQDGSVRYKRIQGGATTSVEGPLKGFQGDNFEVGIGPMSTTFVVTKPPHEVDGKWKMVVDGVELVRTSSASVSST